jgi:hypothetical protein
VLIVVLFNRTSSGGHSVGDISNEARRGHYQRGATRRETEENEENTKRNRRETDEHTVVFLRSPWRLGAKSLGEENIQKNWVYTPADWRG